MEKQSEFYTNTYVHIYFVINGNNINVQITTLKQSEMFQTLNFDNILEQHGVEENNIYTKFIIIYYLFCILFFLHTVTALPTGTQYTLVSDSANLFATLNSSR